MQDSIKLIVGLGNPGAEYAHTRHNAGQDFVERLASSLGGSLQTDSKFKGACGRVRIGNSDVRLLVPNTFMNRSGQSLGALAQFYKIPAEQILVAHDELDLDPGIARFKQGGGHGGHNGLRDIIAALANNKNFYRLRLGIGHPGNAKQVSGYVLKRAPATEQVLIDEAIDKSMDIIDTAVRGDWQSAMHILHSHKPAA